MSASPQPTGSTKRPLEETSSPSNAADQPDAKRPALDKVIKAATSEESPSAESNGVAVKSSTNGSPKTNGEKAEPKAESSDAGAQESTPTKQASSGAASSQQSQSAPAGAHDETAWIHIRAVISSPEAATIIGKGGENVSNIRKLSFAKCTVSDYQKGAVERILTVSGGVDAVAKVCLILSLCGP